MSLVPSSEERTARVTRRAADLTGPENVLLLLPNPGDEIACAGLVAALCARGRPPVVAFLGDGAPGGSDRAAQVAERASRAALALLGVPDGRFLFAGVPMASLAEGDPAFVRALVLAMTLLSWRKDCNVIGVGATALPGGFASLDVASLDVARTIARDQNLPWLKAIAPGCGADEAGTLWDLDMGPWAGLRSAAAEIHRLAGRDVSIPSGSVERFARIA